MQKRISAMKARQNFGQVMNEAALRGDDFIVERAGKAMVAIVSMEKYEILRRNRAEALKTVETIRGKMKHVDPTKIASLIEEAIASVRSE